TSVFHLSKQQPCGHQQNIPTPGEFHYPAQSYHLARAHLILFWTLDLGLWTLDRLGDVTAVDVDVAMAQVASPDSGGISPAVEAQEDLNVFRFQRLFGSSASVIDRDAFSDYRDTGDS